MYTQIVRFFSHHQLQARLILNLLLFVVYLHPLELGKLRALKKVTREMGQEDELRLVLSVGWVLVLPAVSIPGKPGDSQADQIDNLKINTGDVGVAFAPY